MWKHETLNLVTEVLKTTQNYKTVLLMNMDVEDTQWIVFPIKSRFWKHGKSPLIMDTQFTLWEVTEHSSMTENWGRP